jgi:hypothetical protein
MSSNGLNGLPRPQGSDDIPNCYWQLEIKAMFDIEGTGIASG